MTLTLILVTSFYCIIILLVLIAILKKHQLNYGDEWPFISIVIAARNEEQRITATLESLGRLDYPQHKYEVIIIDDASGDNTADIVENYCHKHNNWKQIRIKQKDHILKGKKAALKSGIMAARGTVILTTDADCIIPESWLRAMAACFDDKTSMVLGHANLVQIKKPLQGILQFDNLFSSIVMASSAILGFPLSSVGRNLAFKKESYIKSGGYDSLSVHKSGDDVYLTELFRKKKIGRIRFNMDKNSFVHSRPPDNMKEIIFQQIRKNSKILKKSAGSVTLSLLLFIYHLALFSFPFLYPAWFSIWIVLFGLKLVCEAVTLTIAAKKFSVANVIPVIPFMQLLYPVYISVMGFTGIFQKYEWKK